MDELISVMKEIRNQLAEMNEKLDEIKGFGLCNNLSDIYNKLDEICCSVDNIGIHF